MDGSVASTSSADKSKGVLFRRLCLRGFARPPSRESILMHAHAGASIDNVDTQVWQPTPAEFAQFRRAADEDHKAALAERALRLQGLHEREPPAEKPPLVDCATPAPYPHISITNWFMHAVYFACRVISLVAILGCAGDHTEGPAVPFQ